MSRAARWTVRSARECFLWLMNCESSLMFLYEDTDLHVVFKTLQTVRRNHVLDPSRARLFWSRLGLMMKPCAAFTHWPCALLVNRCPKRSELPPSCSRVWPEPNSGNICSRSRNRSSLSRNRSGNRSSLLVNTLWKKWKYYYILTFEPDKYRNLSNVTDKWY